MLQMPLLPRPQAEVELTATHRPSHWSLRVELAPENPISSGFQRSAELVVVPTSRSFRRTRPAVELVQEVARASGGIAVYLCSNEARISEFPVELVSDSVPTMLVPFSAQEIVTPLLPDFETTDHDVATLGAIGKRDVAEKRNFGVLLARLLERRAVLFLDDDMSAGSDSAAGAAATFNPQSVSRAFAGLDSQECAAVGWTMENYPDNSVICHARRQLGFPQESFLGGGALGVIVDDNTPPFASVYNEDWLFLYEYLLRWRDGGPPVASVGTICQADFNPFVPFRARYEELGDILAEGLFAALGSGADPELVRQEHYWNNVIRLRREMIIDLLGEIQRQWAQGNLWRPHKAQIRRALGEALAMHGELSARGNWAYLFPNFLERLRRDHDRWGEHLGQARWETVRSHLNLAGTKFLNWCE